MTHPAPNRRNSARSAQASRPTLHAGLFVVALLILTPSAHAATGTVLPAHKYAWSNTGSWVNFAPTNSTVAVSDTALTGYAWSANDGWINLSPTEVGVTNDGHGTLGGFAWDQSAGWVSFTGVTIDAYGRFHGEATGANETITFDCMNCDVETNWRATPHASTSGVGWSGSSVVPTLLQQASQPLSATGDNKAQGV